VPIYEYRCENGHLTEVLQSFTDAALEACNVCGAPVQKVLHSPAIHYKGSGFYSTDYGRGGKKNRSSDGKSEGSSDSSSSSSESGSSTSTKGGDSSSSSSSTSGGSSGGSSSGSGSSSE
jgi:putative FmdB family regulatory protein